MRIAMIHILYQDYLRRFYNARPRLARYPWKAQQQTLMGDLFSKSDGYAACFSGLGHKAIQIYGNAEALQKAWAKENGLSFSEEGWRLEITAARLAAFRPEVLFVQQPRFFPPEFIRALRRDIPSLRLVVARRCILESDPEVLRGCDFLIACTPPLVHHYRRHGFETVLVRHGFDGRVIDRLSANPPRHDVVFSGTMNGHRFNRRFQVVRRVAQEREIAVFSNLRTTSLAVGLKELGQEWQKGNAGGYWNFQWALHDQALTKMLHAPVYGLAMYDVFAGAKIVLNAHVNDAGRHAANMKLFEATGTGTCLLTDHKKDLGELFAIDSEVVSYRSADECVEKIRWLLEHDSERQKIARAGQARTLQEHTYLERTKEMIAEIQRRL